MNVNAAGRACHDHPSHEGNQGLPRESDPSHLHPAGPFGAEMKIEVMLADSHPVVRCGLRRMIESTTDLAVAGEAANGNVALEMLRARPWGLAVLDLWMPGRSGLELIKLMKCECPRLPILVFSAQREDH